MAEAVNTMRKLRESLSKKASMRNNPLFSSRPAAADLAPAASSELVPLHDLPESTEPSPSVAKQGFKAPGRLSQQLQEKLRNDAGGASSGDLKAVRSQGAGDSDMQLAAAAAASIEASHRSITGARIIHGSLRHSMRDLPLSVQKLILGNHPSSKADAEAGEPPDGAGPSFSEGQEEEEASAVTLENPLSKRRISKQLSSTLVRMGSSLLPGQTSYIAGGNIPRLSSTALQDRELGHVRRVQLAWQPVQEVSRGLATSSLYQTLALSFSLWTSLLMQSCAAC